MIRTTAQRLKTGQRVKLRHTKQMWRCVHAAADQADGYACIAIGESKQWLSPNYQVQIPVEDDAMLGGAIQP